MTDQDQDPKMSQRISQSYRELGAEEPPRVLDEAILAAARREAGARPATLGARTGRQRWYAPLATAAVLVLAVAVTLHLQVERPGIESPVQQAAAPPAAERAAATKVAKPAAEEEVKSPRRKSVEQPAPSVAAAPRTPEAPRTPAAPEPKPFAADQAAAPASPRSDESRGAASSGTGTLARQAEELTLRDSEAAAPPPPAAKAAPAPAAAPRMAMKPAPLRERLVDLTPEQELERIATLRRQERHDEADKALADFRKRHPDYKISGAMLERVERR